MAFVRNLPPADRRDPAAALSETPVSPEVQEWKGARRRQAEMKATRRTGAPGTRHVALPLQGDAAAAEGQLPLAAPSAEACAAARARRTR